MKRIVLIGLFTIPFVLSGCAYYSERFTYFDEQGRTNHVVSVTHQTFLMVGEAAKLSTETQTGEFIRTVNAEDLGTRPDAESVKAITAGIVEGLKTSSGVP